MRNRIILILLILFIAAGSSFVIDQAANKGLGSYDAEVFVSNVYNNDTDIISIYDCEIHDGLLTVTGEDPQFVVNAFDQEISKIYIDFVYPILHDTFLQIYLAPVGNGFSEGNSICQTIAAGKKEETFQIPKTEYSAFRFDFGQDVNINKIYTVKEEHFVHENRLNAVRLVAVFSIIFFPLCLLILVKKRMT